MSSGPHRGDRRAGLSAAQAGREAVDRSGRCRDAGGDTRDCLQPFRSHPGAAGRAADKAEGVELGLHFARGDLVAIFDAEDRPRRDQVRRAWRRSRVADKRLAVVQAPLNIHNGRDGWIARSSRSSMRSISACGCRFWRGSALPIALGGTSNISAATSARAGGWDAWNVTEDADIGLRLRALGYRAAMIAPATLRSAGELPAAGATSGRAG